MNRYSFGRFRLGVVLVLFVLSGYLCLTSQAKFASAASLPSYVPQATANGTLVSVGSDTMVNLVSYWVVEFKRQHPGVQARIQQAGSGTAPPALLDGSASIAPMSRQMKESEIQAFQKKYGYAPTEIRVALDAVTVYVHKDNPIKGMTLAQVDAIFSATHQCGSQNVTNWGQLGLDGTWQDRPVGIYGRNTLSGTYSFFSEKALCKGKFKDTLQMLNGSSDVLHAVSTKPGSIGYSGISALGGSVRAVPLAAKEGQPFVAPTPENISDGKYPLARYLYIYVNKAPGQPLAALQREFLRMVLSQEGQLKTGNNGFVSLESAVLNNELAKLN